MQELQQIADQFTVLIDHTKNYYPTILTIIFGIWIFNLINWMLNSIFNRFGIIPRKIYGLPGIFCSWILHADFNHLFFNSIPLTVLGSLTIAITYQKFFVITWIIIILNGIGIWFLARKGNHIGASGLVAGYFGFMLMYAYQANTIISICLGAVILYYFGGILLSFFPNEQQTSWEGHILGFIAGIITFNLHNNYNYVL